MSFAWHEIRDQLMRSTSTFSFQRRFDAFRCSDTTLSKFRDPAAVLDALHRETGCADQKNLILAQLVGSAQADGECFDCALTMMLLALWPGLDAIRRRSISRRLGAPDEVASDLLARTTEAIRSLDLRRVNRIAATILRNVERDMIRDRQREAARQSVARDVDPDEIAQEHGMLDPLLGRVQVQGEVRRLIGSDATLVVRVAVDGFSQTEVAIELGLSEAATRKRYQRATDKLRDALREFA